MARKNPNGPSGIIIINKHEGISSFGIVRTLKKLFDTSYVGHTGTLDPMATGVLPVLIGRAVKASDYIVSYDKRYFAHLTLGITTDTEDSTGTILSSSSDIPDDKTVIECIMSFQGNIKQIPPMYSAIKKDGNKLVDLARKGISVEREPRDVCIKSIIPEKTGPDTWSMDIKCSKGTYIRTLCADIGKALGCGGVMSGLTRTETGDYFLSDSVTIEELEKMDYEERVSLLRPADSIFSRFEKIDLDIRRGNRFLSGCSVSVNDIDRIDADNDGLFRVYSGGIFLGIGKTAEYPGTGKLLKSEKLFHLEKIQQKES